MPVKYKLTDQEMRTYGGCQWTLDETKTASGDGELCGPGWLHYYDHPLLAVLLNPIHANIRNPRLFEAEATGQIKDDMGLKGGCTRMVLTRELSVPAVTTEQRVRFAMLCAMEVYENKQWVAWARTWLDRSNRTDLRSRAHPAAEAADMVWAVARAAQAADAAVMAADAAALVFKTAGAAGVADVASWAAEATRAAAWAAANEKRRPDLIAIAQTATLSKP